MQALIGIGKSSPDNIKSHPSLYSFRIPLCLTWFLYVYSLNFDAYIMVLALMVSVGEVLLGSWVVGWLSMRVSCWLLGCWLTSAEWMLCGVCICLILSMMSGCVNAPIMCWWVVRLFAEYLVVVLMPLVLPHEIKVELWDILDNHTDLLY